MRLKPETVGFVRAGMLFLEPPHKWRSWQRDVWMCCCRSPLVLAGERLTPLAAEPKIITISTPR